MLPVETIHSVKSTDPPWMNNDVRRSANRKRREFILNGRSSRYRRLQKETGTLVRKAKKEFFKEVKEEALTSGNSSGWYRRLENYRQKMCKKILMSEKSYLGRGMQK